MAAVLDTTPVLALAHLRLLSLLPELFGEALIPEAVHAEALAARRVAPELPAIREALSRGWVREQPVSPAAVSAVMPGRLHPGEREAIALAHQIGAVLVTDGLPARRRATAIGVRAIGTVGVLMAARRAGKIFTAVPAVERLRALGFYIDDDILAAVKAEETTGTSG